MKNRRSLSLYLRWISANALGELFGLGGTLAVGVLAFTALGDKSGVGIVLIMFLIAVISGVIEATVVGFLQWWAMHPWFSSIRVKSWWLGTLAGALVAYVLGYLPSSLINLNQALEPTASAPVAEPAQWVIYLLAAGMGTVAGAALSFAQWLVLRKPAKRAGLWVPGNMLAWLCGMPIIFWGIDFVQKGLSLGEAVLVMGLVLFLVGVVVGAIHGLFLVRIASYGSPQVDIKLTSLGKTSSKENK